MNKLTIIAVLISTLSMTTIFAKEKMGAGSSGGGNAVDDVLLDFAEAKMGSGKVSFKPSGFKSYAIVEEILEQTTNVSSEFGLALSRALKEKNWYFVESKLPDLKDEDINILTDAKTKTQIAIQNQNSITVNKPWFITVSPMQQAGLIIHEGVMALAMKYEIDHDSVRHIVRVLFSKELGGSFPEREQFLNIIEEYEFQTIIRSIEVEKAQKIINVLDIIKRAAETKNNKEAEGAYSNFLYIYAESTLADKWTLSGLKKVMNELITSIRLNSSNNTISIEGLDLYYNIYRARL